MPDAAEQPPLHALAQAQVDAHRVLAPETAAENKAQLVDILEHFELDIAPKLAPFVADVMADPAVPDHIKELLSPLTAPEHFGESIILGIAIGSLIGPILGAAIAPLVQGLANTAWNTAVSGGAAVGARPLTPDLLAASVLKGVLTETEAAAIAANSGTDASAFHTMYETAGQSIGLEQALLLYRRGQILLDSADPAAPGLKQIVAYSNINPNFYGLPPLLQFAPPSVGEAITGVLKGHLTPAQGQQYVKEAGIDPALHFDWLLASAGRPPGIDQMLELWNKAAAGLPGFTVTQTDVENAVKQSDINDAYLPFVLQLRQYFPPPRSIVPMIRAGSITDAQAGQLLDAYGVQDPWKSAFIAEGHSTKTGAAKELSQAQVVRMYEAQLIDRPTATARLLALHYAQADVDLLLNYADQSRAETLTNATIRKVGTLYVGHKINLTTAATLLNDAGVPTAAQHTLTTLWDVQRTGNVHVPSVAAIIGAGRRQEISPAEVKTRLTEAGVADADMAIFVADGWPPGKPLEGQAAAAAVLNSAAAWPTAAGGSGTTVKKLTAAQISSLYTLGTIGTAEAVSDLMALGYSQAAADELITTFTKPAVPKP